MLKISNIVAPIQSYFKNVERKENFDNLIAVPVRNLTIRRIHYHAQEI